MHYKISTLSVFFLLFGYYSIYAQVAVSIKTYLQGSFDTGVGLMNDNLRNDDLIPLTEPYTINGYNHINGGGGESVSPAVFTSVTGNNAIIDWVIVELRDKNDSSSILATRSALIQRDGDIVDIDGMSPVSFVNASPDDYFIAVRHRNHLGVMSSGAIALDNNENSVNIFCGLNFHLSSIDVTNIYDDYYFPGGGDRRHIVGNFIVNPMTGTDGATVDPDEIILTFISSNVRYAKCYSYCQSNDEMVRIWERLSTPAFATFNLDPSKDTYLSGDFDGDGQDEVLAMHPTNGCMTLAKFRWSASCTTTYTANTDWQFIWGTCSGYLGLWNAQPNDDHYFVGDFDGDGRDELLCVNPNTPKWELYAFTTSWVRIAQGTTMFGDFNTSWIDEKTQAGRFKNGVAKDFLFTPKEGGTYNFNGLIYKFSYLGLHEYTGSTFISDYFRDQSGLAIYYHIDDTYDEFAHGDFDNDPKDELVRYNRNLRFDMKSFDYVNTLNGQRFLLNGNIDFRGMTGDSQNPKYYEKFIYVFGKFHPNSKGSVLIHASNGTNNYAGWERKTTGIFHVLDSDNTDWILLSDAK